MVSYRSYQFLIFIVKNFECDLSTDYVIKILIYVPCRIDYEQLKSRDAHNYYTVCKKSQISLNKSIRGLLYLMKDEDYLHFFIGRTQISYKNLRSSIKTLKDLYNFNFGKNAKKKPFPRKYPQYSYMKNPERSLFISE